MDAPFTRSELAKLAEEVLALDCSAKTQVHAEKMLSVKKDEYSRSFYEAASRIGDLLAMGFTLIDAVKAVAGVVPAVENIKFEVKWWDLDIVNVTKTDLYAIAAVIDKFEIPSPDRALAHKINTNKATKGEWQLFALRYVDFKSRISDFGCLLCEFCSDSIRSRKELTALKSWIKKACPSEDSYDVERPVLPPWRDTESWNADLDEWGYGDDFCPTFEPLSSFAIDHAVQPGNEVLALANHPAQQHPGYTDDVVDNSLIEEEEFEMTVENPDVFEDEELYAAQDAEKNRLLDDAVNLPLPRITNHFSARSVKNFPQILSKSTAFTAQEQKDKEFGDSLLLEAMSYSSFKEELIACEKAMEKDPDGSLLNRALAKLLDSQEKHELATLTNSNSELAIVPHSGSDVAGPSSEMQSIPAYMSQSDLDEFYGMGAAPSVQQTTSLQAGLPPPKSITHPAVKPIQNTDAAAKTTGHKPNPQQLNEQEFPTLNSSYATIPKPKESKPIEPKTAWTGRAAKKVFMNSGIGGKLTHAPPSSVEFHVDVDKAFSMHEIWGFALLGQYVGHNPGHYLINAMIKNWGVKAKYKLEDGWYIFSFQSEEDQEKILIGGPYLIHGRPMILKHIPDKFSFNRRDVATVPLWVRIHGLAARFWTPEILSGIASYVGKPMYTDPVTEGRRRHAYARVLVEINLAAPVARKVPIIFSDGEALECTFHIENEPKYCAECCSFGHVMRECEFMKKRDPTDTKEKSSAAKIQEQCATDLERGNLKKDANSVVTPVAGKLATNCEDTQQLANYQEGAHNVNMPNEFNAPHELAASRELVVYQAATDLIMEDSQAAPSHTASANSSPAPITNELAPVPGNHRGISHAIATVNRFEALATDEGDAHINDNPGKEIKSPSTTGLLNDGRLTRSRMKRAAATAT